ncbi:MAG: hypothetical protein KBF35_02830 [Saprospiraceae bacterium]|jgi:hypothetical protein|nr:hypothetical protein [Saprospiraceae bacterium]
MLKKKISLLFVLLVSSLFFVHHGFSQSFWFGAKGGAAMNFQSWGDGSFSGSVNRDPLFSLNGDIFIESYDEYKKGTLYAQVGFHTRGSSFRFFSFNNTFTEQQGFKFRNIVAEVGAKKTLNLGKELEPYFILGIRGEYTIGTNLDDYINFGSLYYPVSEFVRKFNYGVTAGGGFEMKMSELSNVFVEFSLQPDLSFQYEQQPLFNVIDPWTSQPVNLGLRQVRNLAIELKIGVKFLRKVEYID